MTIAATPLTSSGSHQGPRLVAAASAALLLLGAGAASAHSNKGGIKTVAVNAHYTEPAGSVNAPAANKPRGVVVHISGRVDATADPVPNPSCVGRMYPVSGTPENGTGAIYKGTLAGVGGFCTQAKLPVVTPSGLAYYEEHTFVGTVQGCGTGTFRYTVDGVAHAPDPAKGIPADEYWQITEGSGTGGLVGIRSGLNHRTGAITASGTVFAVFDPAMNSLTCIPTHR